jgi:hypothetical protein
MKISRQDKMLLFEMEFLALAVIIILGFVFYKLRNQQFFYFTTLLLGFAFYFWMLYEENAHKGVKKHDYFEHTSTYIIIGQSALVLGLLFQSLKVNLGYLVIVSLVLAVIMYSVSLSRVILYKGVFKS